MELNVRVNLRGGFIGVLRDFLVLKQDRVYKERRDYRCGLGGQ